MLWSVSGRGTLDRSPTGFPPSAVSGSPLTVNSAFPAAPRWSRARATRPRGSTAALRSSGAGLAIGSTAFLAVKVRPSIVPTPLSNGWAPVVRSTAKSGAPVPSTRTLRTIAELPVPKPTEPCLRIWSPVRVCESTRTPLTEVVTVVPRTETATVWSRPAQVPAVRPVPSGTSTVATGTVRTPVAVGLVSLCGS